MTKETCLVVTTKSWNIEAFKNLQGKANVFWHIITNKENFTADEIQRINPRYIFFPHWSYKVPAEIYENFECVCFHMTDVPYGRGGSPLQNLIVRGHKDTKLTALRMVEEMDAGPVYMKQDLSLTGTAESILKRASKLSFEMIERIVSENPQPVPQEGAVTAFKRRTPDESDIAGLKTADDIYNHIRMLDAEGYPHSYIETEKIRIEFEEADIHGNKVTAKAIIKIKD